VHLLRAELGHEPAPVLADRLQAIPPEAEVSARSEPLPPRNEHAHVATL
jgi:hypothetical protein